MTSLGMIISPAFVWAKVFSIMAITAFVGGSKLLLASAVLRVSLNTTSEVSIAIGSSMAQISEGSLVLLAKAQQLGFVTRQTYLTLIPVCCILLSLSPFSASVMKRLKLLGSSDYDGQQLEASSKSNFCEEETELVGKQNGHGGSSSSGTHEIGRRAKRDGAAADISSV